MKKAEYFFFIENRQKIVEIFHDRVVWIRIFPDPEYGLSSEVGSGGSKTAETLEPKKNKF